MSTPVIIPQTPRARPLAPIQQEMQERFTGFVWCEVSEEFIKSHLDDYDHWEKYNAETTYSKRPFLANYTGNVRQYQNFLYVLKVDDYEHYYVVAKRIHDELEDLEDYCTCVTCITSSFNPIKYIWCPQCTRCIKSGVANADPKLVSKAKQLKSSTDTAILSNPRKCMQMVEYGTIVVLLLSYVCGFI